MGAAVWGEGEEEVLEVKGGGGLGKGGEGER